ncbi:amino acid deaminase [Actinophytocola sp.]|uniref:amino acid deaminase n=1 Tax=Actinophytocola sp. TaxID=1872138 RepID=UPI002D810536|nr:amino acid deaminase [Actinophytocola sp.]HET9140196.1 amino acid deaminase [Actinophytocola sp.]
MPSAVSGLTIAEAAGRKLNLFRDGFFGPVLVLDGPALEHNLATMAKWCAARGVALAPHGKTTMAPQLFARQLDHGAWGITAATASQLRVYRAFGVRRIVLANQLVDPAALHWLAAELAADPDLEFCCWVDSERGVALMDAALRAAGAQRPVEVLVELGAPGGRAGARDLPAATAVARAAAASPRLRLVGTSGYEGILTGGRTPDALATVTGYLGRLRELTATLARDGLFDQVDRVIVSAGGSAYFDLVADALTAPWRDGPPVLPVLRSGCYLTHDDGSYRTVSPLGAHPRIADVPPLRPALRVWAQVSSRPEPGLALLTAGKRDLPYDVDLPEPQLIRSGTSVAPLAGCRVTALNDQHAYLAVGPGADPRVGDWVGLGVSHPCTAFDKWPLIPLVGSDGETVTELIRTYF